MPLITQSMQDWAQLYDGFDMQQVGIGLSNPNIYASANYAKLKQQELVLGGLATIFYAGFEHDREPLTLSMHYESQYNDVLAINLHYAPQPVRQAILKTLLASNIANLRQNLPLIADYRVLKNNVPAVEGMTRRYKVVGIRVVGNIPIMDWSKAIRGPSRWQNMYRQHQ